MKANTLLAALLCAVSCNALAAADPPQATRLASTYARLAGSEENALALVKALRAGEMARLTYEPASGATTPTIATIDPPTKAMGWGNVKVSLGLAQDQLTRLGITNPTPEQLQAALNGGEITVRASNGTTSTTTLRGVLQMRADGMGWGQIAKAGGTKVGPVVSAVSKPQAPVAPARATSSITTAAGPAQPVKATKSTTLTTANGAASAPSRGLTTAAGAAVSPSASKGLTTAQGAAAASHGKSAAHGHGLVNAGGGAASAGPVTASGQSAGKVTTAHAGGNGKAGEHGNGKGKGG